MCLRMFTLVDLDLGWKRWKLEARLLGGTEGDMQEE